MKYTVPLASILREYHSSFFVDGYTYNVYIQFPANERIEAGQLLHNHARFELHAVASGSVLLQIEDQPIFTLEEGNCCAIAPHVYHFRKIDRSDTKCFVMFISCPNGAPLQLQNASYVRLHCAPELIRYFGALENEFSTRRIGSENYIQSLCAMLLITVLRELAELPKNLPLPAHASYRNREDLMDNYFALHYGYDISAQDLADRINVTTRQLARIMQQRYGCTFRQHLLNIRLYHARRYLATTDSPIWQIAVACGFSNQGAFATAFHKHVGCSPSQYRQQKNAEFEKK